MTKRPGWVKRIDRFDWLQGIVHPKRDGLATSGHGASTDVASGAPVSPRVQRSPRTVPSPRATSPTVGVASRHGITSPDRLTPSLHAQFMEVVGAAYVAWQTTSLDAARQQERAARMTQRFLDGCAKFWPDVPEFAGIAARVAAGYLQRLSTAPRAATAASTPSAAPIGAAFFEEDDAPNRREIVAACLKIAFEVNIDITTKRGEFPALLEVVEHRLEAAERAVLAALDYDILRHLLHPDNSGSSNFALGGVAVVAPGASGAALNADAPTAT